MDDTTRPALALVGAAECDPESPDGVWTIGIGRGTADGVVTVTWGVLTVGVVTGPTPTEGTVTDGIVAAGTLTDGTVAAGTETEGTETVGTERVPDAIEDVAAASSTPQARTTATRDRRTRSGTGQPSPPHLWAQ